MDGWIDGWVDRSTGRWTRSTMNYSTQSHPNPPLHTLLLMSSVRYRLKDKGSAAESVWRVVYAKWKFGA